MRSRSPGGGIFVFLQSLFPDGSPSALYIGDLLKEGPANGPEEQKLVADGRSSILAFLGSLLLFPAIGAGALVDALWGHCAANAVLGALVIPSVFVMTVAILVQVAKFRRRFEGVQPLFGRISWVMCVTVTAAVAIATTLG